MCAFRRGLLPREYAQSTLANLILLVLDPKPLAHVRQGALTSADLRCVQNMVATEFVLRVLGLMHCQGTLVGDSMVRGVSGGERR